MKLTARQKGIAQSAIATLAIISMLAAGLISDVAANMIAGFMAVVPFFVLGVLIYALIGCILEDDDED